MKVPVSPGIIRCVDVGGHLRESVFRDESLDEGVDGRSGVDFGFGHFVSRARGLEDVLEENGFFGADVVG